jgi:phage shock protein A
VQINVNLNVNGQVTIVHQFPAATGASPPATVADLEALGEKLMSALSEKIASVSAALDAAIARVQADVATLQAKIDELQAAVDAGTASPADIQALEDLKERLDALDPTSPETLPAP